MHSADEFIGDPVDVLPVGGELEALCEILGGAARTEDQEILWLKKDS